MNEQIKHTIQTQLTAMPPQFQVRIRASLETVAKIAYEEGKINAISQIMTSHDVANHFNVSVRRANAIIRNRHEKFGVGAKIGRSWFVLKDDLVILKPYVPL